MIRKLIENIIVFVEFFQITVAMFACEKTCAHFRTLEVDRPMACVAFAWEQRQTNYAEIDIFADNVYFCAYFVPSYCAFILVYTSYNIIW